jgi:DnaJ like chaperone protein
MNWWGKAIGGTFGFLVGGPLGGLFGAALGHQIDTGLANIVILGLPPKQRAHFQKTFFTTTFSVMGHLAKADGWVSPSEIRAAEAIMARMRLSAEQRRAAIELFNQGKRPDFPLDEALDTFRRECHRRHILVRLFLQIQLQAAIADGHLNPAKRQRLWHVFNRLGISHREFELLLSALRGSWGQSGVGGGGSRRTNLKQAYAVLETRENASNAEIKRAYRRLMSQHHPDKLVAKGLPEEMVALATEKANAIGAAYEQIRKARGF